MLFAETQIAGAYLIEADRFEDERGYFERTFVRAEFEAQGLDARIAQLATSSNRRRGTLRGLHHQARPHEQAKVVRVIRGVLFDVIVDLRPASDSYRRWLGKELVADSRMMLYVPPGVAHGFQTLEDDTTVTYQLSTPFEPASEAGVRWDDPALAIAWPLPPADMTARDRAFRLLGPRTG